MKNTIFVTAFLFSATSFAQSFYANDAWPSDEPRAVEIVDKLTIEGRLIPDLNTIETISCTLKENTLFHPDEGESDAAYVSVSEITTFQLLEDYEEAGELFTAGTILNRLSFLEDGGCLYQEGNARAVFEMSCLDTLPAQLAPTVQILNQGDEVQHWFQANCANGNKAWFEINELIERGGDAVQSRPVSISAIRPLGVKPIIPNFNKPLFNKQVAPDFTKPLFNKK